MNKTILYFHLKAVRNYIKYRLDWITVVEIVLFAGGLLYYVLHSTYIRFAMQIGNAGVEAAWSVFFKYQAAGLLLLLSSAFAFVQKRLFSRNNFVLLAQPLSLYKVSASIVDQLLLMWALLLPVWMGFLFSFVTQVPMNGIELMALIVYHAIVFFSPILLGMFIWTAMVSVKIKNGLLRWMNTLLLMIVFTVLVLLAEYNHQLHHWIFHTLIAIALVVMARSLIIYQVQTLYKQAPEKLAIQRWKMQKPIISWIRLYLIFTPISIKPLVTKDAIFITRQYKVFAVILLAFIVTMIVGIFRIDTFHDALQWLLFISFSSGYVFANMSFRFSEPACELLSVVRSLPVSVKRYWFAKFWSAMLPVIWTSVLGMAALFTRHGVETGPFLLGTLAMVFINVTFVLIQTNFALYSYPYTRYASMWYNLYIVIAVLFFTILLFPPLSIGFLLFGYLAIFRVFKRLQLTDVLYD